MAEETDRVTVSTYVPAYQRDEWRDHAERLDMSQSEFVRTMVQAGRRGFDLGGDSENSPEPDVADATPGGSDLKTPVLEAIEEGGILDWDDLVDELIGDVEDRLEAAVEDLEDANRIRYRPRQGGYTLLEDRDGE